MAWPKPKEVLGCMMIVAVCGLPLWAANAYIGDLPTHEQAPAWRWFWGLWVAVTVTQTLAILPRWLNNTLLTHDPDEIAKQKALWDRLPVICGVAMVAVTLIGTAIMPDLTFYIAGCAVGGGLLTAVAITGFALVTTKKGRAMREGPAARGKSPSRSR